MPRNRFLFDLLGLVLGVAVAYLIGFFIPTTETATSILITIGGILAGGVILGFFAYRNDGVKIAGIICGLIAAVGIVFGILMITGVGDFLTVFSENVITALVGTALAPVFIIIAIMLIVGSVLVGLVFVGASAIGSVIGEAVWKDKQALPVAQTVSEGTYQPISPDDYQPATAPAQQPYAKSRVCPNCGISNTGTENFCTNCGSKLE